MMTQTTDSIPRGANGQTTALRRRRIAGADLHAAILGRYSDEMVVHRQAHRITDTDSDELILVEARQSWWVARRICDRVVVWAYPDRYRAEVGFDDLLRDTKCRGEWIESRRAHQAT
jgi:hypothetical protein